MDPQHTRQICRYIQRSVIPSARKMGDERKEEEIEQEYLEGYEKIHKRYIATIFEDVNNEFDKVETSLQKFIYTALIRAREELIFQSEKLAEKLDYMKWIVNIQKKHDCGWYDIKDCLKDRNIKIISPLHGKEIAKRNFHSIVEVKYKGKVTGEYNRHNSGVDCICKFEHKCKPTPACVFRGNGICKICSGKDFETARQNTFNLVKELGGQVIGQYLGARKPLECICSNGHPCSPMPTNLGRQNMCKICAGNDKETAKKKFYQNIEDAKGEVLGEYINCDTKVMCRCAKGHICYPIPYCISIGRNICLECSSEETQSIGERRLIEALSLLKIGIVKTQYTLPNFKKQKGFKFSYDGAILVDEKVYLYEYHGEQHEKFNSKFHKTQEGFALSRQRDLIKIFAAKQYGATLIILDYNWIKYPVEKWVKYLQKVTNSDKQLIAESHLHGWIHNDNPTQESINKWIDKNWTK